MKTISLFKGILFVIFLFAGINAVESATLEEPLRKQECAGVYANEISQLNKMRKEKDTYKFFYKADELLKKIHKDREKNIPHLNKIGFSEEQAIAQEWAFYLISSTPLICEDELISGLDLDAKEHAVRFLFLEFFDNNSKILGVKNEVLQLQHKDYLISLMKDFNDILKASAKFFRKYQKIVREHKRMLRNPDASISGRKEKWTQLKNFEYFQSAYKYTMNSCESFLASAEISFVERILKTTPKSQSAVLKILRQAGYYSDFEISFLLQRTIGREKDTAYLFAGLPSEKQIDRVLLEDKKEQAKEVLQECVDSLPSSCDDKTKKNVQDKLNKILKSFQNPKLRTSEIQKIVGKFQKEISEIPDSFQGVQELLRNIPSEVSTASETLSPEPASVPQKTNPNIEKY